MQECGGEQNATMSSSAYSPLTNSSAELSSNEGDLRLRRHDLRIMPMTTTTPATSMSTNVRQSDEIRRIIDDFSATLSKATAEIKVLTREKAEVERAYEDLMEVNENLIKDLRLAIQQKKEVEAERDEVVRANEGLFDEAQRLSDKEAVWAEEKATLESELRQVTQDLDGLKNELCDVEALEAAAAERNAKLIAGLKTEKADLTATIDLLEIENKKLRKELEMAEDERDAILSRKEMVSGENMQLIVEAEHIRAVGSDLVNQVKTLQDRCKELELENSALKSAPKPPPVPEISSEKFASLLERNKLLSEWREQLIEKNQVLTDENKKLKEKCGNLEELLSEEEMNIADMLELIRTMQVAAKNGGNTVAAMPQISAVAAKLRRDYK